MPLNQLDQGDRLEDHHTVDREVLPSYLDIFTDVTPFYPVPAPPLREGDKVNTIYFHPLVPGRSATCNPQEDLSHKVCKIIIHWGTLSDNYDQQITGLTEHHLHVSLANLWNTHRHESKIHNRKKSFLSDLNTFCEGMMNAVNHNPVSHRCQVKCIEDKKTFNSIAEIAAELTSALSKGVLILSTTVPPHKAPSTFSPKKLFRRNSSFGTAHGQASVSSQASFSQHRPAKLYIEYSADLEQVSKVRKDLINLAGTNSEELSDAILSRMTRSRNLSVCDMPWEVVNALVSGEDWRSYFTSAEEMGRDPFQVVV
ncbi:hypothetical protein I302_100904 [Kwoniella bestiolae CBS 10118]|uniref:Uncharacterized protein n=1 Tax=Kwoniella bestiolae CBS 10118 TaxID=1296100 RepID=A0A1B9G6G9_9TREE|nr:hypothetical protein I302_04279 [Kwoniella bestiolae CBS 10118]OCF26593.1 hypothetical protein I302_04279 [Kwoniella bestiolae CBS 10118]